MGQTIDFTLAKRNAAKAALELVVEGELLGIGTGSTALHFIEGLAARELEIAGAISSSEGSTEALRSHGIPILTLDEALARAERIPLYVDGADEATDAGELTKGGGGALTREKVIAAASARFVCIIDPSKRVTRLGAFPLPIEVVPMAVAHVERVLEGFGGRPRRRDGFVTDNGNAILDVAGMSIDDPRDLEQRIESIAGVVTCGLFAQRRADELIVGTESGVERYDCAQ